MILELTRPLITLDCETTGTRPAKDRICQIGVVKLTPDGTRTEWETLVNPTVPITPFLTNIHGISDEMVKDAPTFEFLAAKLAERFLDVDFCGYNLNFDLNFLIAEFERAGVQHSLRSVKVADAFELYKIKRPRTLSDAIRDILGREHVGAHGALPDARGTLDLLEGLMEQFPDLPRNIDAIHHMLFEQAPEGFVDRSKRIAWINGEATPTFGKWAGTPLNSIPNGYLRWMQGGTFSQPIMALIEKAIDEACPSEEEWKRENAV